MNKHASLMEKTPGLIIQEGEPVFSEPWEAQAFALVIQLYEQGLFEWGEWAETLGAVISNDTDNTPYYKSWLQALEQISRQKGLVADDEVVERSREWKAALKATPHGKPILLANGKV